MSWKNRRNSLRDRMIVQHHAETFMVERGYEPGPCTCRKYGVDPDCPIHGRPGQLSLEPEEPADDRYDPSTAEIPY